MMMKAVGSILTRNSLCEHATIFLTDRRKVNLEHPLSEQNLDNCCSKETLHFVNLLKQDFFF